MLFTQTNLKSRKVSTQSTSGVVHRPSGIPGKDKNNNKLKPKTKFLEKPQPRKKLKAGDPEFYSAMGCSLKLSQIRIRQRLLFVMWRAVYDEAVRKAEQEHLREKVVICLIVFGGRKWFPSTSSSVFVITVPFI